eukprot:jgi/Bigna1/90620/estExt_fgenesh1_pg.C_750013
MPWRGLDSINEEKKKCTRVFQRVKDIEVVARVKCSPKTSGFERHKVGKLGKCKEARGNKQAARRATEMLERQKKLRAHVRPKDHEDDTVLLHGEYVSRAERQQYNDYVANMTIYQRFTIFKISICCSLQVWVAIMEFGSHAFLCARQQVMLRVRHSFIHGKFRRYLTYMALYAAGCEIMHDLHLTHYMQPEIAQFLSFFHTKHAVALIALSHWGEHIKEILEAAERPKHYFVEKAREDMIRIYGTEEADPIWPKYIQEHHARCTVTIISFVHILSATHKDINEIQTPTFSATHTRQRFKAARGEHPAFKFQDTHHDN